MASDSSESSSNSSSEHSEDKDRDSTISKVTSKLDLANEVVPIVGGLVKPYIKPIPDNEVVDFLRKGLKVVDIGVKLGSLFPPAAPYLAAVASASGLLSSVINILSPPPPDPKDERSIENLRIAKETYKAVVEIDGIVREIRVDVKEVKAHILAIKEDMQKIKEEFKKLNENIREQFVKLMEEENKRNFNEVVFEPLFKLLLNFDLVYADPNPQTRQHFLDACEKFSPMNVMDTLIAKLQMGTTPLFYALKNDDKCLTTTAEEWMNVCAHLMERLMFLQSFMDGLKLLTTKQIELNISQMTIRWQLVCARMQGTIEQFKMNYWPKPVMALAQEYADLEMTYTKKMEELKQKLLKINTTDYFYIFASDAPPDSFVKNDHRCVIAYGSKPTNEGGNKYTYIIVYRIYEGQNMLIFQDAYNLLHEKLNNYPENSRSLLYSNIKELLIPEAEMVLFICDAGSIWTSSTALEIPTFYKHLFEDFPGHAPLVVNNWPVSDLPVLCVDFYSRVRPDWNNSAQSVYMRIGWLIYVRR